MNTLEILSKQIINRINVLKKHQKQFMRKSKKPLNDPALTQSYGELLGLFSVLSMIDKINDESNK